MTEKELLIFNMQPESTKRAMLRQERFEPQEPWPPKNWLAVPDALTMEERVNARTLGYQEAKIEEDLRKKRGKYIEDMRSAIDGPRLTGFPEEKRKRAIEAFMIKGGIKERFVAIMESIGLVKQKVRIKDET